MKLKPGDIVRWKAGHGSRYTPGPYRVITVNDEQDQIQLRHLDGRQVFFKSTYSNTMVDHRSVEGCTLELDPFLDAASKSNR